jgi:pimeloyl-ACP methyl ester carboxylesterase
MSATEREQLRGALGPVKQIAAGLLDVGYVDVGPPDGPAVVLLHGWPYDIHSYTEVSPLLAAAGYRVIVPYLRGYGTTRFQYPPGRLTRGKSVETPFHPNGGRL